MSKKKSYTANHLSHYKLVIDERERHVTKHINDVNPETLKSIEYSIETINIGDYAIIYDDQIIAIIERKSWKDLASSMRDGRKENVHKLLELRKETNCRIFYLIEGKNRPNTNKNFNNINYKHLQAHLDHLMFRDNISVIYADDPLDCLNRMFELIINIASIKNVGELIADIKKGETTKLDKSLDKTTKLGGDDLVDSDINDLDEDLGDNVNVDDLVEYSIDKSDSKLDINDLINSNNMVDEVNAGNYMSKLKQKIAKPNSNTNVRILQCLNSVGFMLAELLIENKMDFNYVYNCEFDQVVDKIKDMKYSKRVIGKEKATRIAKCLSHIKKNNKTASKYIINILSSIDKLSDKSAKYLVENNFVFSDLMTKKITLEQFANLHKSEKSKVGLAAAKNVFNALKLD